MPWPMRIRPWAETSDRSEDIVHRPAIGRDPEAFTEGDQRRFRAVVGGGDPHAVDPGDVLRPADTPLQHMIDLVKKLTNEGKMAGQATREQDLRSFLGQFNFSGDMSNKPWAA